MPPKTPEQDIPHKNGKPAFTAFQERKREFLRVVHGDRRHVDALSPEAVDALFALFSGNTEERVRGKGFIPQQIDYQWNHPTIWPGRNMMSGHQPENENQPKRSTEQADTQEKTKEERKGEESESKILRAIEQLRCDMHRELSEIRGGFARNEAAVARLQRPAWKRLWSIVFGDKVPRPRTMPRKLTHTPLEVMELGERNPPSSLSSVLTAIPEPFDVHDYTPATFDQTIETTSAHALQIINDRSWEALTDDEEVDELQECVGSARVVWDSVRGTFQLITQTTETIAAVRTQDEQALQCILDARPAIEQELAGLENEFTQRSADAARWSNRVQTFEQYSAALTTGTVSTSLASSFKSVRQEMLNARVIGRGDGLSRMLDVARGMQGQALQLRDETSSALESTRGLLQQMQTVEDAYRERISAVRALEQSLGVQGQTSTDVLEDLETAMEAMEGALALEREELAANTLTRAREYVTQTQGLNALRSQRSTLEQQLGISMADLERAQTAHTDAVSVEQHSLLHRTWDRQALDGVNVKSLAISRDGDILAIGNTDGTIQLRRAASLELLSTLSLSGPIQSLASSPVDGSIVAATQEGITIFDPRSGSVIRSIPIPYADTVRVLDDGRIGVIAHGASRMVILDQEGTLVRDEYIGPETGFATFDRNGTQFTYGVRSWMASMPLGDRPGFFYDFNQHFVRQSLSSGELSPDGQYFVAGSGNGFLVLLDAETSEYLGHRSIADDPSIQVLSIRFVGPDTFVAESVGGSSIATRISTFRIENGAFTLLDEQARPGAYAVPFTLSPDGTVAVYASGNLLASQTVPGDGSAFYQRRIEATRQELASVSGIVSGLQNQAQQVGAQITTLDAQRTEMGESIERVAPSLKLSRLQALANGDMSALPSAQEFSDELNPMLEAIEGGGEWSLDHVPDRLHALTVRGNDLVRWTNALSEALPSLSVLASFPQSELRTAGTGLRDRCLEAMGALRSQMQRWQTLKAEFDVQPWQNLSPASMASLFPGESERRAHQLSIVSIQGASITVSVRTPADSSIVEVEGGSSFGLSRAVLSHAGGTALQTCEIIFDGRLPTGDYALRLLSQTGGDALASAMLHWDAGMRTLTMASQADGFQPTTTLRDDGSLPYGDLFSLAHAEETSQMSVAAAAIDRAETIQAIGSNAVIASGMLDTPQMQVYLEEQRVQLAGLVNAEAGPDGLLVSGDRFVTLFYATFPHWREENRQQTMQDMHLSSANFDYYRSTELAAWWEHVRNYNVDMAQIIAAAMDATLTQRRGEDVVERLATLNRLLSRDPGHAVQLGLRFPASAEAIIGLCNQAVRSSSETLLQRVRENQEYIMEEQTDFMTNVHYAGSGAENGDPPTATEGDRREANHAQMAALTVRDEALSRMRAAARYLYAAVTRRVSEDDLAMYRGGYETTVVQFNEASHLASQPYNFFLHAVVNRRERGSDVVEYQVPVAGRLVETGTQINAMHGTAADMLLAYAGPQEGIGGVSVSEHLTFGEALDRQLQAFILSNPEYWYDSSISVPGNLESLVDSHGMAGRIVLGLAQRLLAETNEDARLALANAAEAITGVSAASLLAISRGDATAFGRGIARAFQDAGFGFLFESIQLSDTGGLRAGTSQGFYRGGELRMGFDFASGQRPIHHIGVYILDDATGNQLHFNPLSGEIRGKFFLTFPINPIARLGSPTIRLSVVAWYADAQGQIIDEGHLVTETGRVMVGEGISNNAEMPEGAIDITTLTAAEDYTFGEQRHLGADFNTLSDRPMRAGDAIWLPQMPGVQVTVVDMGPITGYGTMAVTLEFAFEQPQNFRTEVDIGRLIPEILSPDFETKNLGENAIPTLRHLQSNSQLLSEMRGLAAQYESIRGSADAGALTQLEAVMAERIGIPTHVTTNRLRLLFGHLRPSNEIIWNEDARQRFEVGKHELQYEAQEVLNGPTRLGYIEFGDLDLSIGTPGRDYAGISYGEHVHVTAYSPELIQNLDPAIRVNPIIGTAAEWDTVRTVSIRAEDVLRSR